MATVVIVKGIAVYNEFYIPFLYMPSQELGVISTSLFRFKGPVRRAVGGHLGRRHPRHHPDADRVRGIAAVHLQRFHGWSHEVTASSVDVLSGGPEHDPGGLSGGHSGGRSSGLFGGVEAGGTKIVCAVGTGPDAVLDRIVIPTTTPDETLGRVAGYFAAHRDAGRPIAALGIASFGPLDLAPASASYGRITTTPKPGWAGTDLVGFLGRRLDVPIALDTDVNGAAYGEYRWGAGRGLESLGYVTVGTGIGGGVIVGGEPLHGMLHPEMGHLHVRRHPADQFAGSCPFHGDCLEGLASGPAIERRLGRPATALGPDLARAVELEAYYLGQLMTSIIYLLMPHRIVVGGGVLNLDGLLPAVRRATGLRLGEALDGTGVRSRLDDYIVAPGLGEMSGVLGALGLAERLSARLAGR